MKIQCPYRCDYCLNLKGETNHWWMRPVHVEQFNLLRWDSKLADANGYEHICSESCAAKALSKWMTQQGAHGVPRVAAGAPEVRLSSHEVQIRTQ